MHTPTTYARLFHEQLKTRLANQLKAERDVDPIPDVTIECELPSEDTPITTTADLVVYDQTEPTRVLSVLVADGETPPTPTQREVAHAYAQMHGLRDEARQTPSTLFILASLKANMLERLEVSYTRQSWEVYSTLLSDYVRESDTTRVSGTD